MGSLARYRFFPAMLVSLLSLANLVAQDGSFPSGTGATAPPSPAPTASLAAPPAISPAPPYFVASSATARQGDPVFAEIDAGSPIDDLRFEVRDSGGHVLARGKVFGLPAKGGSQRWGALAGLAWQASAGKAELRASGFWQGKPFVILSPLLVAARVFPSEDIVLDMANTTLRSVPDPKKTEEALSIQAIYARVDRHGLWAALPFVSPVGEARRSAGFGDRRRYLYASGGSDSAWHSGIDFAVPVGSPVLAPGAGKVVFSGMRIVTGYTMVIEHAPGLYSVLMHLSKGLAPEGALVKRGELVAYSGASGLATGPHLHWEVRAGEVPVDPDFFLGSTGAKAFPWLDTEAAAMQ